MKTEGHSATVGAELVN